MAYCFKIESKTLTLSKTLLPSGTHCPCLNNGGLGLMTAKTTASSNSL